MRREGAELSPDHVVEGFAEDSVPFGIVTSPVGFSSSTESIFPLVKVRWVWNGAV